MSRMQAAPASATKPGLRVIDPICVGDDDRSMLKIKRARRAPTAPFVFSRMSPDPQKPIVLHVRHLFTNEGWVNDTVKRKPIDTGKHFTDVMAERDRDLADIANFCAVSWDNATDDNDQPVPCTPENVLATLKQAIENGYDEEVQELRLFVKLTSNFREPVSSADLGKG